MTKDGKIYLIEVTKCKQFNEFKQKLCNLVEFDTDKIDNVFVIFYNEKSLIVKSYKELCTNTK